MFLRKLKVNNFRALEEDEILAKFFLNSTFVKNPPSNYSAMQRLVKQVAFRQIDGLAAKIVYARQVFVGLGLRREDIEGAPSIAAIASNLRKRISSAKDQLANIDPAEWESTFTHEIQVEASRIRDEWEFTWPVQCNGKRLFEELQVELALKTSLKKFKLELIREMAVKETSNWIAMQQLLQHLLQQ